MGEGRNDNPRRRPRKLGLHRRAAFPVWAAFNIDMSGTAPVPSWSSILVNRGQKEGATGCFVHTAGGLANQGWYRSSRKHDPCTQPTLVHIDGTKGLLPGSLSALQGTYGPWPSPLQWGENRCGLLQSGKVVGVALDLLAELAGQSGYSSACSQGNSK